MMLSFWLGDGIRFHIRSEMLPATEEEIAILNANNAPEANITLRFLKARAEKKALALDDMRVQGWA